MSEYYALPNSAGIIEADDDVLHLRKPLGSKVVLKRLKAAPWLTEFLKNQWAPGSEESYVDAYSATARIIATAIVIRSKHPYDLAFALGLPTIFVRMILLALICDGWSYNVLPDLSAYASEPVDVASFKNRLSNYMETEFSAVEIPILQLLKAVGQEVLGVGSDEFNSPEGIDVFAAQMHYTEKLPKSFKDIG